MADKSSSYTKQIRELTARLDKLESKLSTPYSSDRRAQDKDTDDGLRYCAQPEVPIRTFAPEVSDHRARLILMIDKKWVNGTKLRYYFFESGPFSGASNQKDLVREGFEVWEDVGIGISFEEVSDISEAEVRIGFQQGDGAWSYVGRDVIDVPGQFERTMNFGWDLTRDPRGVDTPVHEIGHTLGFPHAHQNPFAGIEWDEDAVYSYFGGSPNFWPRQTTFHNILRKLEPSSVEGSNWDPDSIMHYGFPGGLIVSPAEYRNGLTPELGLSDVDVAQVRRFYPPITDETNPKLTAFNSQKLKLAPGEQANYTIEPSNTGEYTFQTFGSSDTVMVLFEEVNGELRYVAGDDDSGTDLNSQVKAKLRKGQRYVLRIRLYLNYASSETAVMMW